MKLRTDRDRTDRALRWAAVVALMLVGVVGIWVWTHPRPMDGVDPARVYRVCEQYAGLDLSGMASLCHDVGFQQTS